MEGFDTAFASDIASGAIALESGAIPPPAPAPAPQPAETATTEVQVTQADSKVSTLENFPDLNAPETEQKAEADSNPSTGETEAQQAQDPGEQLSPQKARWQDLKKRAEELEKIKPEYEQLRQQIEELKSKPQIPQEIEQELNELRQLKYATEIESTPEWKSGVAEPQTEVLNSFKQLAEYYQVDVEGLIEAADSTNPLIRGKAIREFLSKSEVDEVTPEALAIATAQAEKLHATYRKQAELRQKAGEVYQSLEAKRSMETEAQRIERERAYETSHKQILGLLEQRMPDYFKNKELAEAVRSAKPGEEPQEQAYQAAAAVLLPQVANDLKQARNEIATLKKQLAARAAAGAPSMGAPAAPVAPVAPADPFAALEQAMRADGFR